MPLKFLWPASEVLVLALVLTPEAWAALVPATIAAVFVGAVNMYVARTQRLLAEANIAKVEKKVDALKPVVDKIDTHVNGEKSRAEHESAQQKLQIELQREMINEMRKAAELLAQAKATSDTMQATATTVAPVPLPPVTEVPAVLEEIKINTGDTAKNTAKTDATVTALKEQA